MTSPKQADELLSCPFCGDEAQVTESGAFVECRKHTRALRPNNWNQRARLSSPSVPKGWQLVPAKATDSMRMAAIRRFGKNDRTSFEVHGWVIVEEMFEQMLAFAPQPPSAPPEAGKVQDGIDAAYSYFHKAWTAMVGQPSYDKKVWKDIELQLERAGQLPDQKRISAEPPSAQGERDCICADPENCTQTVPGYRCRKGEALRHPSPVAQGADPGREGFYEKMWKDFCSLQRGDMMQILRDVEHCRRSHPSHPTGSVREESAWLIESVDYIPGGGQSSFPVWVNRFDRSGGVPSWSWSPDPNKAVRFSRESDAKAVIAGFAGQHDFNIKATEHIWQSAPPKPTAPDGGGL